MKLKRVKDVKLKLFTAPFVILAIGYLMGFVAFLWERWTGWRDGRHKVQTTNGSTSKSDKGLERQKIQETNNPNSPEIAIKDPTLNEIAGIGGRLQTHSVIGSHAH